MDGRTPKSGLAREGEGLSSYEGVRRGASRVRKV